MQNESQKWFVRCIDRHFPQNTIFAPNTSNKSLPVLRNRICLQTEVSQGLLNQAAQIQPFGQILMAMTIIIGQMKIMPITQKDKKTIYTGWL